MPPRPTTLLRLIARPTSPPWTCHSCLRRTTPSLTLTFASRFHTTSPRLDDLANHYETLHLPPSASPAEIKRQFYALSKKNHPDHNRNDPTASTRFVAISEAYHTLSVPEKRAQYDAQMHQTQRQSWSSGGSAYPQGSYSSASFGSRPASGLNKKRSTFRGPPPSFYKTGGYGDHSAKRNEHAYSNPQSHEGTREEAPGESYGDWGTGYGPGQHKHGHEVPHFNDKRHKETHDQVNEHIYARRRRTARSVDADVEQEYDRGGMLINFLMVSGIIGLIGMTANMFGERNEERRRKDREG